MIRTLRQRTREAVAIVPRGTRRQTRPVRVLVRDPTNPPGIPMPEVLGTSDARPSEHNVHYQTQLWESFEFYPGADQSPVAPLRVNRLNTRWDPRAPSTQKAPPRRSLARHRSWDRTGIRRCGMAIAFQCPSCGHGFKVDRALAGKKGRCKTCGHAFMIPSPPGEAAPARNLKTNGEKVSGNAANDEHVHQPKSPRPSEFDPHLDDDLRACRPGLLGRSLRFPARGKRAKPRVDGRSAKDRSCPS